MRLPESESKAEPFWAAGCLGDDDKLDILRKTVSQLRHDIAMQRRVFQALIARDLLDNGGEVSDEGLLKAEEGLCDGLVLSFMANLGLLLGYDVKKSLRIVKEELGLPKDMLDRFDVHAPGEKE